MRSSRTWFGVSSATGERNVGSAVDLHSHLVPGVDDGARDVADVLASVRRMAEEGIGSIVTTPHIRAGLTLDRAALSHRLDEVAQAWRDAADAISDAFPDVVYRQGHEVMLDIPNPSLTDPRLRMAGTDFVLVEWPRMQVPPATVRVLERIVASGYRPVIAHPERYGGVKDQMDLVAAWKGAGAYLQVNYGSFVGRYGSDARTNAFRMLRRGWIDYLATDFHGRAHLKPYRAEAEEVMDGLGAGDVLTLLSVTNPSRLLVNEAPLPAPRLPEERGFWARIKELVQPDGR